MLFSDRVEAGPYFVPGLPHGVAHSRRYLNGTIKPYDVLCFMLNLNSCHSIFNFTDARVVINGERPPL